MFKKLATITFAAAVLFNVSAAYPSLSSRAGNIANDGTADSGTPPHPYIAPKDGDLRSPCPALNVLANHGYLSRDGRNWKADDIAAGLVAALNLDPSLAKSAADGGVLTNGNPITKSLSLGDFTGSDEVRYGPGVSKHGPIEHDASMTRGDFYFGDNHSYNDTIAAEARALAQKVNGGVYNVDVLSQYRKQRYEESKASNPTFFFFPKQAFNAYSAAALSLTVFGGATNHTIAEDIFHTFLGEGRIPDNWKSAPQPVTNNDVTSVMVDLYKRNPVPLGGFSNGKFNLAGTAFPNSMDGVKAFMCEVFRSDTPGAIAGLVTSKLGVPSC